MGPLLVLIFCARGLQFFFSLSYAFQWYYSFSSNFGYKIWTLSKDYFGSWKAFGVKKTVQF